ncbi:MAG: (4Fe-4S)-binding protein [Desulfobacteraceae bacterium]|nr:MAG: (4Fe-4S)-binding protein [Desulfobacteraceae bacterium]
MRELVVISGKGGTGKTSIVAAFAALADNAVLCDADVDAADLHLILAPEIITRTDFMGGHKAIVRKDLCTECGICRDMCRFNAVSEEYEIDPIQCEGCGVCVHFCPSKAIEFPISTCGEWYESRTRMGPMIHARLGIAEENSGRLVSLVRKEAQELAKKMGRDFIITDGPPGVGCPVIASIGGASAVLVVTEPTVAGIHDMQRVVSLADHFRVPSMVCINKYDLNVQQSTSIEGYCRENSLPVLGLIPFDPVFTRAMILEKTVLEYDPDSPGALAVKEVWNAVKNNINIT